MQTIQTARDASVHQSSTFCVILYEVLNVAVSQQNSLSLHWLATSGIRLKTTANNHNQGPAG